MPETSVKVQRPVRAQRANVMTAEPLESRTLLSVSLNTAGFTVVTPSAGTRVVYCSSSTGNDRNSGLSASSPVQSLARAESLLQNHTDDQLLLKAGDTWNQNIGVWGLSGVSTQSPMVIGSYGTGVRPTIYSNLYAGFLTVKTPVSYLDVLGVRFDSNLRDPNLVGPTHVDTKISPTGFDFQSGGTGILVENCEFENYAINLNFQNVWGTPTNVTVRRNEIVNAWAIHGHAEGLYALGVNGLTLTGNTFDHNGWSATIPYAYKNIYNHDCYLSADDSNVVVTDNIFSNAACAGLEDRPGGIVENNVFLNDPVGAMFGLTNGAHTTVGGVKGVVSGNVFMGGSNIGNLVQGIGLEVGNVNWSGATVTNNLFADGEANGGPAILLAHGTGQPDPQDSVGINNLSVSNNTIYNWKSGIDVSNGQVAGGKGLTAFNHVSFVNNRFEDVPGLSVEQASSLFSQETWSGNVYYAADTWYIDFQHAAPRGTVLKSPIPFVAPSRSAATYDATIGGNGTQADLLARADAQTGTNWNTHLEASAIAAYILAGFAG